MLASASLKPIEQARKVVHLASDRQASDIVILDIRELSDVTDYFVVLSGSSQRQIGSLVEDIEQELKEVGVTLHHREGSTGSSWRLLDYGDLVVHIFEPSERNFYDIEGMWSKAQEVVRVQ